MGFVVLISPFIEKQLAFFILIVLFFPSLLSPIVILRNRIFGIAYYFLSCFSLFSYALFLSYIKSGWHSYGKLLFEGGFLISSGLSFIAFVVAVPTALVPYIREKRHLKAKEYVDLTDLSFIDQRFDNIKSSFSEIQSTISRETSYVAQAMKQVRSNLISQEVELKRVQSELSNARREVAELQSLSKLSKEQQEAFLHLIAKQKYIEYIIGFILGVLAAALVEYGPKMFRLLSK
jgi:hypothetical protein